VIEGKGVVVTVGVRCNVDVKVGAAANVSINAVITRSGVKLGVSEASGAGNTGLHAGIANTAAITIHTEALILACTV